LNISEPFWLVLETRARNRFPPPTSLMLLQDVLQEEWYKIPLETHQNLYETFPKRIVAVLKAKGGRTQYCDIDPFLGNNREVMIYTVAVAE
jgi:hypothetical protein